MKKRDRCQCETCSAFRREVGFHWPTKYGKDGYAVEFWHNPGLRFDPNEGIRDDLYDPDHLNPAKGGNKASDDYW